MTYSIYLENDRHMLQIKQHGHLHISYLLRSKWLTTWFVCSVLHHSLLSLFADSRVGKWLDELDTCGLKSKFSTLVTGEHELGWGVGGGGGTQRVWSSTSHTFLLWFLQLPHLFPSLGALSIPNVLKFLPFSPGSHYPNSGFLLCHLTVNLHFPHSQITTTPLSLPPPPSRQQTFHKIIFLVN